MNKKTDEISANTPPSAVVADAADDSSAAIVPDNDDDGVSARVVDDSGSSSAVSRGPVETASSEGASAVAVAVATDDTIICKPRPPYSANHVNDISDEKQVNHPMDNVPSSSPGESFSWGEANGEDTFMYHGEEAEPPSPDTVLALSSAQFHLALDKMNDGEEGVPVDNFFHDNDQEIHGKNNMATFGSVPAPASEMNSTGMGQDQTGIEADKMGGNNMTTTIGSVPAPASDMHISGMGQDQTAGSEATPPTSLGMGQDACMNGTRLSLSSLKSQQDQAAGLGADMLRQKQLETEKEAQGLIQEVQLLQQQAGELKRQEQLQSDNQKDEQTTSPAPSLVQQLLEDAPFDWGEDTEMQRPPQPPSRLSHSSSSGYPYEISQPISTMKRRLPQSAKSTYSEDVVDTTMMDDIESQSKKSLSPISNGERQKKNLVSSSDNNRSWRYRILLRKIIYAIITDLDDETLRRDDTEAILIIITLLKEAMLGVIIAFFLVSFILFVDHRFLLGLPTARNFRKATFAIMNDQETLRNFEENAGLKFMDMEEYDSAMNEVALAGNRTELAVRILKTRSGDLIELKKDLDVIQVEFPAMFTKMGLDRFCDTCIWGPGQRMSCLSRAKALEEKYNTPKYEAMMSAMERKSCVKSDEETEKERKMIVQEDELLKEWQDKKGADWCGECEWDGGMSCQGRADYLNFRYGVTLDRAKAKAVISVSNCKMSEHEGEEEKMARLCEQCPWENKMTCKQRVDYLMHTYKDPERKAILATMEKPSCDANPESK